MPSLVSSAYRWSCWDQPIELVALLGHGVVALLILVNDGDSRSIDPRLRRVPPPHDGGVGAMLKKVQPQGRLRGV